MSDNTTDILNEIQTAVTELRTTNEANLKSRDTLLEEKLVKINETITNLEKKIARPAMSVEQGADEEYKSEFNSWARKGVEMKSMNTATPADGGVALPKVVEAGIYTQLTATSPIRALSNVVSTSSQDYRIIAQSSGSGSGWVGELAARPETASPQLVEIVVPTGEIYAHVAASQRSLDDLSFDVESFLQNDISVEIAKKESAAFVNGDGTNKPAGFMAATGITTVKTGHATLFNNADAVFNMVQAMAQPYRAGAAFIGNAATVGAARLLKDTTNNYIWGQSLVAGVPSTLAGYPVYECEDMASIGAGNKPLVFANLKQGYVIADRKNTTLLRDPYSNKPFVTFYVTKRVGGVVRDKAAFVTLTVAA